LARRTKVDKIDEDTVVSLSIRLKEPSSIFPATYGSYGLTVDP